MTSQNETSNGQSTDKAASTTSAKTTTTKSTSRRQSKSTLVKAEEKDSGQVVFVLNDGRSQLLAIRAKRQILNL
ncbi:MAG: hypothetical protein AAF773_20575 [Cyanobacteria bacterium P01_D01_bin.115]